MKIKASLLQIVALVAGLGIHARAGVLETGSANGTAVTPTSVCVGNQPCVLDASSVSTASGSVVAQSTSAAATNVILRVKDFSGTELMRVQQNGNTGIGTSSPATLLDVAGQTGLLSRTKTQIDVLVPGKTGALIFCSNCATSGDVCASTGTAAAQWRRIGTTAGCGANE